MQNPLIRESTPFFHGLDMLVLSHPTKNEIRARFHYHGYQEVGSVLIHWLVLEWINIVDEKEFQPSEVMVVFSWDWIEFMSNQGFQRIKRTGMLSQVNEIPVAVLEVAKPVLEESWFFPLSMN